MLRKHTFYGNKIGSATLSGGNWRPALPLANLKDRSLTKMARSMNANPASTVINIDLGGLYPINGVMFGPTNMTARGRYRVMKTDAAFTTTIYGGTWQRIGASVPFGSLPYGSAHLYDGCVPWDDPNRLPWMITVFSGRVGARYLRVEIEDVGNPDGHVDLAYGFIASAFVPTYNYDYGNNGLSLVDRSFSSESLGGAKHFWRRTNKRRWQCQIGLSPEAEAYGEFYRMLKIAGFDQDVFVVPDPEDTAHLQDRSFLGTLQSPDPIAQVYFQHASIGFSVEELNA